MTTSLARHAIQLSSVEMLACWESLGLGEPPYLLQLRRPSGTQAAQHGTYQKLAQAMVALALRNLSDGTRPTEPLAGMLRLLARPHYQLDIKFSGPADKPILGLGAVTGSHGLVLTSIDGAGPYTLHLMDGTRVAGTLLNLLGTVQPGISHPVNIPGDVFDNALRATAAERGSVWRFADHLADHGVPRKDATAFARMNTETDFGGQLGLTTWTDGSERRGPWVIGFVRSNNRFYMQLRRHDNTVTMCPTDIARLHHQWRDLLEYTARSR